ncbi:MAG: Nif11-like leader peptide family natural product precursor [Chlamydiota bacterium]
MTLDSATKFLDKLEKDSSFRQQLTHGKTKEERKKTIENAHFHFTKDEYKQAYKEKYHQPLTDKDLRDIAAAGAPPQSNYDSTRLLAMRGGIDLW